MIIAIGMILSMVGGGMVGANAKNRYAIIGLLLVLIAQMLLRIN